MLEEFRRDSRHEAVLKLASLPKSSIEEALLRRGLNPSSIEDAKAVLALVSTPVTPNDVVGYSFTKHGAPPIFGKGRFGDGSFPVFYTALERETCEEEIKHHLQEAIATVPFTRFYQLITCEFSGVVLDLCGKERDHPDLVSKTESGYPFCQALARTARSSGIEAFHTPSARRNGGICTPVFSHSSLANPRFVDAPRATI